MSSSDAGNFPPTLFQTFATVRVVKDELENIALALSDEDIPIARQSLSRQIKKLSDELLEIGDMDEPLTAVVNGALDGTIGDSDEAFLRHLIDKGEGEDE